MKLWQFILESHSEDPLKTFENEQYRVCFMIVRKHRTMINMQVQITQENTSIPKIYTAWDSKVYFCVDYEEFKFGWHPTYSQRIDLCECPVLDKLVYALNDGNFEVLAHHIELSKKKTRSYSDWR